jgi:hypothetical protein
MNEKLLSVLSNMLNLSPKELGTMGAKQFHFFTEQKECSVTVFEPSEAEQMKKASEFCNDVVWLENVRFSATSL